MRTKLLLLVMSMAVPVAAPAQNSESRMDAIAVALGEMRRGLRGKINLNVPPQPDALVGVSREEAKGAAKRLQLTVIEDPSGFARHPADVQLAVRGATIGADSAKILLMRAVRMPNGEYEGTAATYAVDLERVDGRWKVKKAYFHSVY